MKKLLFKKENMRGKYYKVQSHLTKLKCGLNLPQRNENLCYTNTCVQIFIAPLFVIAPNWEQPTCTLTEEQINYGTSEFQSAIKRAKLIDTEPGNESQEHFTDQKKPILLLYDSTSITFLK